VVVRVDKVGGTEQHFVPTLELQPAREA
jgi:hypothetical protein